MRLPRTAFGCMILVLLAASGMGQTPEAVPAAPIGPPAAGLPPLSPYPLPYAADAPTGASNWTIDTTRPVPRQPGERTQYGGEQTYIDPACANWQDSTTYAVRVEGLLYKLDRARDQSLLVQAPGPTPAQNVSILSVGNLDYNMEGGARLTIEYDSAPEEGTKLEVSYFGIYDWGRAITFNAANNLQLPGNFGQEGYHLLGPSVVINDFNSAASMEFRTQARLNSVEANLIYAENNQPWALIGGVRFLRFEEGIFITSRREVAQVVPTIAGPQTIFGQGVSVFDQQTLNDLFGIQGGMRMHRCSGPWDLVAVAKAALYSSTDSAHNYVTNANGSVVERSSSPSNTAVAYSFDATVSLSYAVRKNVALVGSYNALWISQLARATDNLDFSQRSDSGSILDRKSTAFMNGLSLGMESRW